MVSLACMNPALANWSLVGPIVGVVSGKDISLLAEAGILLSDFVIK